MRLITSLPLLVFVSFQAGTWGQDIDPRPEPEISASVDESSLGLKFPDQEWSALTLADLERIATRHNPTLAIAAARMDAARGQQVQAGLYPNPIVGYHAVEMALRGTAGQQGAFITQRFITGGKLALDQAIAGKDIDEAHFQFHAQQQRVLSDVRVGFYGAYVAQRRVELTQELVSIGDELVRATRKLIEGRQVTENDLLQAEIRAEESYILHDNARNQHIEAWRRLVAVAGVPTMEMVRLAGELEVDVPQIEWDECYAQVLSANPTLYAARTRVDRARMVLQRARREPIPDIDLTVSHRHHNVTEDNVTNVQLGIPIPLFDKNQGNIRSARAEWVAACNEVRRIELDLQNRLAVAYRRFANATQQKDRYGQRIVPRAKQSLRLVTEGYQLGQVEYLILLTAQQTYLQVNLAYLDSILELWEAASAIEGQLLTGSLSMGR